MSTRRPRVHLDHQAGSEERQAAFDAHLEGIREDAAEAERCGLGDENPYEGSDEPHEAVAWRGGVAEARLFNGFGSLK